MTAKPAFALRYFNNLRFASSKFDRQHNILSGHLQDSMQTETVTGHLQLFHHGTKRHISSFTLTKFTEKSIHPLAHISSSQCILEKREKFRKEIERKSEVNSSIHCKCPIHYKLLIAYICIACSRCAQ